MKTKQEYLESLRVVNKDVFVLGERVQNYQDHPLLRPSINSIAETYALANEPKFEDIATTTSHLTEDKINRFTHIHRSKEDLLAKIDLLRILGQRTGSCFQRCAGWDALNAVFSVTYDLDQKKGTDFHVNFVRFLRKVQTEDLVTGGAMTDPKGDRSKRPSQQDDPDLYLHIVKENSDGIVVRGAKMHQTGAIGSHEILVMPTITMREEEKDYSVSFAVPADSEGIMYVLGRQGSDTRKLEEGDIDVGNIAYGGHEALVLFDDVFIPRERVFLCGDYEFTGTLVERFAGSHRSSYGGCKVGMGDVLIGATASVAEYIGVAKASHVRDKIIEMTHLNETLYSCGIACSSKGSQLDSGSYQIDPLLANVCKLNVTRFPYEIGRLAEDITGGILGTCPSEKDIKHPEIGPKLQKYLKGVSGVPIESKIRMIRLIENLTHGPGSVSYFTESIHGAGSPQAQRIMISRLSDIKSKKNLAQRLANV